MRRWLLVGLCLLALGGCGRPGEPADTPAETEESAAVQEVVEVEAAAETEPETELEETRSEPVQVKGIYLSGPAAGNQEMMERILTNIADTEINAVVIDLKDDSGRVTCPMDSPLVTETEASTPYVQDMRELIRELKEEHGLYVIARVVAFRDPWLAEKKPEWCLKLPDGSVFRDRSGLAWVNPYRQEVWDYLVEIGTEAAAMGFDEVQFDYIRFCTERGVGDVVFDEAETRGRSKTDVITEFTAYAYDRLSPQGIYVAADVFGAIIGSEIDSMSVGQVYEDMAAHLDYICPMIYPSHYGDGNFGIEHPDTEPYRTILAALQKSSGVLGAARQEGQHQAIVRPWLQDFTASYLKHYIEYGPEEIRAQIQATYDAGYDEWMLWSAACSYTWDGLKTKEEAQAEREAIAQSRAAAEAEAAAQSEAEAAAQSGEAAAQPETEAAAQSEAEAAAQAAAAEAAAQPGEEAAQPGEEAAQPGEAAAQPGEEAAQPGEAAAQPETEAAAQPGEEAAQLGEAGQEPRESQEPAPVLESLPTLPAHISPAGTPPDSQGSAATVIPQMQID